AVGRERTLVACFNFGGHYEGPGRVVHGTKGGFHVGELDGGVTKRLRALRDTLSAVQECEASDNVLGCVWSKIAMASVFFATALVDADVKEILARERYHDLMADLVAESVAAADAMGVRLIELHGFDPESLRPERRSSAAVRRALEAIAGSFNPLQQRTGIWIDPVVHGERSLARNTTAGAMSSGEPVRRSGVPRSIRRTYSESSAPPSRRTSSRIRPGATAFTRIRCGPSSIASTCVSRFTAALLPV